MRLTIIPLCLAIVLLGGCGAPATTDDAEGGEAAQTASSADLLSMCPALDGVDLSAVVVGDASTLVKQSYRLAGYTRADGTRVPARPFTAAATPSTLYSVRFYRDASGKSKFQLSLGTWAGIQSSITDDAKRLTASGTISVDDSGSRGELTITSRRDALRSVLGHDLTKISFSELDCANAQNVSLDVPIITLDKTSGDTVEVTETGSGRKVRVSPAVKWNKKADSAPLRFEFVAG